MSRKTLINNTGKFGHPPPKGRGSKSEDFYYHLKSLGYFAPRQVHEKPEHFDYLFNDKETSNFMDNLMAKVISRNVVSEKEFAQFKKLDEEGRLLSGKDLETAVSNAKKREIEIDENNKLESIQKEELLRRIEEKNANIVELEKLNNMICVTITEKLKDDAVKRYKQENQLLKEIADLDTQLAMQESDIRSVLEALSSITQGVLQRYQSSDGNGCGPEFIWSLDWNEILGEEDKLVELCQHFIEEYGTDLIVEEGGGVSQPLVLEEIRRIFQQYSKDIERLKHIIIYEYVQKIEMTADTTANSNLLPKLRALGEELRRVSTLEPKYRRILIAEAAETNRELEAKLKSIKSQKLNQIRKSLARHCNGEMQELTDFKYYSLTKVSELFSFVLDVLTNQRARVFIVEQLLKVEGRRNENITKMLQNVVVDLGNFREEKESFDPDAPDVQSRFSLNDKELAEYFTKFDIPLTVMFSYQSTWDSLAYIREQRIDKIKMSLENAKSQEINENIAYLIEKENDMFKLWNSVQEKHSDNNNQNTRIFQLEEIQEEMKNKLSWYAENKDKITKDAIQKKFAVIQEVKAEISKFKREKEKRVAEMAAKREIL